MRRRLEKQTRKEEILDAAFQVFVKEGLGKASIRSIARQGGFSPALALHHFQSLDDLFLEVLKRVIQEGRSKSETYMQNLRAPEDLLRAYIDSMFDWVAVSPEYLTILLQFYHYAVFNERFNQLNVSIVEGGRERIRGILAEGVKERKFPLVKDVALTAKTIQDILIGAFVRMATTREVYNPHKERRDLHRAILGTVDPHLH